MQHQGLPHEDARIECDLASLPRIQGDRIALIQLLENLLSIALIYRGNAPPYIRISVERQEQYWIFAVADNGIGIDSSCFEWIFKMFGRLQVMSIWERVSVWLSVRRSSRITAERSGLNPPAAEVQHSFSASRLKTPFERNA